MSKDSLKRPRCRLQGVGEGTGSQEGLVPSPGVFIGAFKKYRSLWQPDWGKPRRRSRSYIQVCMWHVSPAHTAPRPVSPGGPVGGGGGNDTKKIQRARKAFRKGEERPALPHGDWSSNSRGHAIVERGFEIELNQGWQIQCPLGLDRHPSRLDQRVQ